MGKTKIEWSENVWNFLIGCDKVSAGCKNCYAINQANIRQFNPNEKMRKKFAGTVKKENGVLNWTGQINFDEETLLKPLSNKKPTKYFVNSLSDLFHENVQDEWINRAFNVMYEAKHHIFQILTKRPGRMLDYISRSAFLTNAPLENVWLGVSVENQKTADERIPILLETPAAVRWLSVEPLLEKVELWYLDEDKQALRGPAVIESGGMTISTPDSPPEGYDDSYVGVDWVVTGGESGPGARPLNLAWIESIVEQCKSAHVPVFVKQLGRIPMMDETVWREKQLTRLLNYKNHKKVPAGFVPLLMSDAKGGNISEFPEDLQIRQFPNQG